LKAICPQKALWDWYMFMYPGGVYNQMFTQAWGSMTQRMDLERPPVPVDDDPDGKMAAEALAEHVGNLWAHDIYVRDMYRDTYDDRLRYMSNIEISPSTYIPKIEASGVSIYHMAGWWDSFPKYQLVSFLALDNPAKIIIGPWHHSEFYQEEVSTFLGVEHHRWFDYVLKGIDNGIMDELPVYYYTFGAPAGKEWRFARKWPLPHQISARLYFYRGPTRTVDSVNDGYLKLIPPRCRLTGHDDYTVDYTCTWGLTNKWTNTYAGQPFDYGDMTERDEKGLTYTSRPLPKDLEMTGHPVVHLWVTSTATDVDFFVALEEVDKTGYSHYVTEGILRASHRAIMLMPPYDDMRIPYHRSYEEDLAPLPSEPVELVIDMMPISYIFKKGSRIRLTITNAELNTFVTHEVCPAPTVRVYRSRSYTSYISLPIIPSFVRK